MRAGRASSVQPDCQCALSASHVPAHLYCPVLGLTCESRSDPRIHFHLPPRLCPSTAGCSPPGSGSGYIHCRSQSMAINATEQCLPSISVFHCLLPVAFLFHLSPRLCPSSARCSPPSVSSIVFCLVLSCFTFHLGFVHPLQDVALHQCLPLSSVCCFPNPGGSLLLC